MLNRIRRRESLVSYTANVAERGSVTGDVCAPAWLGRALTWLSITSIFATEMNLSSITRRVARPAGRA